MPLNSQVPPKLALLLGVAKLLQTSPLGGLAVDIRPVPGSGHKIPEQPRLPVPGVDDRVQSNRMDWILLPLPVQYYVLCLLFN